LAASPEVCEIDVPLGSDPLGIFDSWTEPFMDDRQSTLVASHRPRTGRDQPDGLVPPS
jgi:hypothetical protein